MMRRRRSQLAALALTITLACGGSTLLKSFRVALASSSPLVNSLVASGAIPQTKATAIIADFDAGAACGLALQQNFHTADQLPKEQQRPQKFAAANTALRCFREIINRQNFAAHPRIQQAADIADGILSSLAIFYSDNLRETPPRATSVVIVSSEQELEERLKERVKSLEAALKP